MSTQKPTVVVLEPVAEAGLEFLREGGVHVERADGLKREEWAPLLARADGLIVRSGVRVDADLMERAPKLRAVARAGVGLDNVDVEAATSNGVAVMNAPGGNARAAAEHTFALMLAMARHIVPAHQSLHGGEWRRHDFVGNELAGKTLGVVGLGRIGALVAARARAFEMQVLGFDPYLTEEHAEALGVQKLELDDVLAKADVVTLHVPLNDATRGLLDAKRLSGMKQGAVVLNCARGGLIDEDALADALRSGHLAAAGIDVFTSEPPKDNPLMGLPNVVHTPHLGASTREAKEGVSLQVAQVLLAYLLHGDLAGVVNLPFAVGDMGQLGPLMDLADRLGRFQAALLEGPPTRVEVEVAADEPIEVGMLAQSFLCGLLRVACGDQVNVFNARIKSTARGIAVTEGRRPAVPNFPRLLSVRVHDDKTVHTIEGGLLGPDKPRIVQLDGYDVDVEPIGDQLVLRNADVPGVLGAVGTLLGKHTINIGEMRLGRGEKERRAISVWKVDQPVSAELLAELRGLSEVEDARFVRLGAPAVLARAARAQG